MWAILALSLISVVTCAPFIAGDVEAATPEGIAQCMEQLSTMKLKVLTNRKIRFWDAQANMTARCYSTYVPSTVASVPKGQGYYGNQWTWVTTSQNLTEEQCYDQP